MNIYSDTSEVYGDKVCHIIFHHSGKEKLSVVKRQQLINLQNTRTKHYIEKIYFVKVEKMSTFFRNAFVMRKKSCLCTLHVRHILQIHFFSWTTWRFWNTCINSQKFKYLQSQMYIIYSLLIIKTCINNRDNWSHRF